MIQFDIITIFPKIFDSFLKESLIKRAQEKKLIKVKVHDLRKWAKDKRRSVDDRPFGGGLGMVMMIEPIYKAIKEIKKKSKKSKVILFSPRGKLFSQKKAHSLSKMNQIILICGRYEGVDERVKKLADEVISMGEYDLMGGEVPSMAVLESVSRLVPGVIGKEEFLKERTTKKGGFIEGPQYTRPEVFCPKKNVKWRVPKVLISGNHKKIEEWKRKREKAIEK